MGASGRPPRALVERRVRTPEVAFPDAGCDTADVLRRFEGAIERMPGVAASPALGTLIDLNNIEIRESASSCTAQNWSWRVSTQETVYMAIYFLRLPSTVRCLGSVSSV